MGRNRTQYIIPTITLFFTELLIALYVQDDFVRPYAGDMLVVILIYCFLRIFLDIDHRKLALAVLLFAFFVEFSQHLGLIGRLGLQDSWLANIILGSGFEWTDMLMYILGIFVVLVVESLRKNRNSSLRKTA